MKILYCIDSLARGGTELQLTGLIDRLDRAEFESALCTIRPFPSELVPEGVFHLDLDVPRLLAPSGLSALWKLAGWLKAEKIDVVQTFFQDSTILGGTAARMAGVPVRLACFRDLGFWRTRGQEMALRRVYPMMTGFIANSQVIKDHIVEKDRINPDRIQVIPNGVDVAALRFRTHSGPTMNIGIVGNLNRPVKRIDLFLEAASLVAADFPDITWHVLGDGNLRGDLEAQVARLGLKDQVKFVGRVADVPSYLADLQVGVLCSDSEGFSNALLEYMFLGCACVATDVGGNGEVLTHGQTGLLGPVGDAAALATNIKLLVEDIPLRQRLAENARRFVEANYSWEKCISSHEEVYRRSRVSS